MNSRFKLILELGIVIFVLFLIIVLMRFETLYFASWEASVFIAIPLVVAIMLNLPPSELGLVFRYPLKDIKIFALVCIVFIPPFVLGFYIYEHFLNNVKIVFQIPDALGKAIAINFLYFALPEELLFRGYLQKRLRGIFPQILRLARTELPLAGIICAIVFALAHVVYELSIYRFLVFFPALIFAWLRYKTDSILAATLFHGTCNIAAYWANNMFVYPG